MSANLCPICKIKNEQIKVLKRENKQLRNKINLLRDRLNAIASYVDNVIQRADTILSEHQPRGKWAYAKGAKEAVIWVLQVCKLR